MIISSTLKNWYLQNKRDLPWRNTQNPYHIWVSEVILQQTRVAQGLPYYHSFLENFPTIESLANANEDHLLKVWQGLGYYSRARNMQAGAKFIVSNYNSKLPSNFNDLLKIKGIGNYTAAAIASLAFNLPYPVVDGNVNRVISRIFGITDPVNSSAGIKLINKKVNELIDINSPGMFNQSIMEFGALHCTPKLPNCKYCPFTTLCYAYNNDIVDKLPVKQKQTTATNRYFNYIVPFYNQFTYLKKRENNDIWKGLFEFPLLETDSEFTLDQISENDFFKSITGNTFEIHFSKIKSYTHKLSHRNIQAKFIPVSIEGPCKILTTNYVEINWVEFEKYPVSRLIHRYTDTVNS